MARQELPQVIFLGTNGWYDTAATGSTVCALIKTKRFDIVLDAGYGLHKLDRYADGSKPVIMLLSHFHLDHIAGLHTLTKFRFKKGLTICGPAGARRTLKSFVAKPFTVPFKDLPYPVKILELPSEAGKLPFKVSALPLVHADPVLGYRVQAGGRTITYITDTGPCPNAVKLALGADLLITECANLPGEYNPGWPHFNPETAAGLAAEAGAKRLALTHFSAARYPKPAARALALRVARRTFPKTIAAKDGLCLFVK
jgi:ribonuclease BN (tRNA processing enzyme)